MKIPSLVLRQLYTNGSLTPTADGVAFSLKNRLTDAQLTGLDSVTLDGTTVASDKLTLTLDDGTTRTGDSISPASPVDFPLRRIVTIHVPGVTAEEGVHKLELAFAIQGMGKLSFKVKDSVAPPRPDRVTVPRDREDDFSDAAIKARQAFVEEYTGSSFEHIKQYSFDPHITGGNVEAQYHEEIYRLMTVDGLTQIHNKRYFEEMLEREVSRCARYGRSFSLILFDIDHFKLVNDTHGHLAGDAVLRRLGTLMRTRVRRDDVLARVGGEEFAVILPEVGLEGAVGLARKMNALIDDSRFEFENTAMDITISLGVATWQEGMTVGDELVKRADEKLYEAKDSGRNRVCY